MRRMKGLCQGEWADVERNHQFVGKVCNCCHWCGGKCCFTLEPLENLAGVDCHLFVGVGAQWCCITWCFCGANITTTVPWAAGHVPSRIRFPATSCNGAKEILENEIFDLGQSPSPRQKKQWLGVGSNWVWDMLCCCSGALDSSLSDA